MEMFRSVTEIDEEEKKELLKFIWNEKYEKDLSIRQIAQNATVEFGIDVKPNYVFRYLNEMHDDAMIALRQWTVFRIKGYVERYEGIMAEAMMAWDRSKEPLERRKTRQLKDGTEKEDITIEQRLPDPAYLSRVMEAMRDVRKLLGMDAATKFEYTHRDQGGGAASDGVGGASEDANKKLLDMLSGVLQRDELPEETEADE